MFGKIEGIESPEAGILFFRHGINLMKKVNSEKPVGVCGAGLLQVKPGQGVG